MRGNLHCNLNIMLTELLRSLFGFSDILFTGLKVIVPVVFLIYAFRFEQVAPIRHKAIIALNLLLLGAGSLFTIAFVVDMISCNPFERELRLEILSGSNWYRLTLPIIGFAILPHLFWIRRLRRTMVSSMLLVMYWYASFLIVEYSINGWQFGFIKELKWMNVLRDTAITTAIWLLILRLIKSVTRPVAGSD